MGIATPLNFIPRARLYGHSKQLFDYFEASLYYKTRLINKAGAVLERSTSFVDYWIRISYPRSFGSWCVKGTDKSTLDTDSSVPLKNNDPECSGITDHSLKEVKPLNLMVLTRKLKLCISVLCLGHLYYL